MLTPHPEEVPSGLPALCNGKGEWNASALNGTGSGQRCWEFTPEFAEVFNAGHAWIVNHTQDMLAHLGGPVIDGPYGKYNTDVCDFDTLRDAVAQGQRGTGAFVIEASKGGCTPDPSCIASYLLAAEEFTYLGCLSDEPQLPHYPDLERPLGPPTGPAIQAANGTWIRTFEHGTVARWYPHAFRGTVQWPGEPVPPVPMPPPPAPPLDPEICGSVLKDHTFSQDDVGHEIATSAAECCQLCEARRECTQWAWHGSTDRSCHLHNPRSIKNPQKGTTAAYMPNRTRGR